MKTINYARSIKDGIIFYSNKMPLAYKIQYDENKNIISEVIPSHICDIYDFISFADNEENKIFRFKKWHIILFDLILISICVFILKDISFSLSAIYFSIIISKKFFDFIEKILYIKRNKNLGEFHSAEHMAINAYEKLQRIPSLEEIRKASRFSKECGSMILIEKVVFFSVISIIIGIISRYHFVVSLPIIWASIFLLLYKKINGWMKYFQVFVTSKPSDSELILAIEGLKFFEKMEEEINFEESEDGDSITFHFSIKI